MLTQSLYFVETTKDKIIDMPAEVSKPQFHQKLLTINVKCRWLKHDTCLYKLGTYCMYTKKQQQTKCLLMANLKRQTTLKPGKVKNLAQSTLQHKYYLLSFKDNFTA